MRDEVFILHLDWKFEEVKLHNYNPNFVRGCVYEEDHSVECENEEGEIDECKNGECSLRVYVNRYDNNKCIAIGLKINGTNIECIDYS